jgi:hypothetical protein
MRSDVEIQYAREVNAIQQMREQFEREVAHWHYSRQEIGSYWHVCEVPVDPSNSSKHGATYACGYDKSGRPIMFRQYKDASAPVDPGLLIFEEFVRRDGDVVTVSTFKCGSLLKLSRMKARGSLVTDSESVYCGHYSHWQYEYAGRKIMVARELSRGGTVIRETTYGPNGEQTFFRVRRDGSRHLLGQPLPKGITVKSLQTKIQQRLTTQIVEIIRNAGIHEPIYCVAMVYDAEGNDALPPGLAVGLEGERQKWIQKHGPRARDFLWNPAEFSLYATPNLELREDEDLDIACDLLNGEIARRESIAPAEKTLNAVAANLNRTQWPAQIQRTEDFVVYAVDAEGGKLRKNFKAALPESALVRLKSKKLI